MSATREWDGSAYDRLADPMTRWGIAVVERLELRGDETVLDAGCGSGRVTERLLQRLPAGRVIGLDTSRSMLDEAQRRLSAWGDRVALVQADLLELSLPVIGGTPVDAVLSTATFHWITDHDRLFRNLHGVLKPGGQLVAQCGGAGNIARLLEVVANLGMERPGGWEYADAEVTAQRLRAAGFTAVQTWLHNEPTPFADADRLMDYLDTVCLRQVTGWMAENERRSFLESVVNAMPEPVIDYVRLNIVARRGE